MFLWLKKSATQTKIDFNKLAHISPMMENIEIKSMLKSCL